jgi:phenylalanyl-tRNA synthetase beta chain
VRWARPGEKLRTLDDVDRVLDSSDLVITDDSGPIALAGVMGGASTEIRADTTDVVLEAAHFEAVTVSYTARRHRLGSEASRRFERGVDDDLPRSAAALALKLIADLGAGTPSGAASEVDCRSPRQAILIDPELPGRIAGVAYPATVVEDRLTDIGCEIEAAPGGLEVMPPSWRPDLKIPVDLVEEVIRLEGYDQLPSTVPNAPAGRGLTRPQRLRRQIGRALADFGLAEVLSSPFVNAGSAAQLMLDPSDPRVPSVRIANPVSDEEPFLRTTLLPGLFDALARNVGRGTTDVALFETGPVFRMRTQASPPPVLPAGTRPTDDDLAALDNALPSQPNRVAGVLAGARERAGWWGPGRPAQWPDAIAAVQAAARAVGVTATVGADPHAPFHPGRSAAMYVGDALLGHAGELHPRVVEACDLPARTVGFEIDPDVLIAASPEIAPAAIVSPYPPATLDIAVVVAAEMPSAAVATALAAGAGELLETIRLFDVYRGEQAGAGKKSLAFSLRLRALDRTLTADEATVARDAAVAEAARVCGAVLR